VSARQPWAADPSEIRLSPAAVDDRDRVGRFLLAMDREGLYQRHFAHGDAPNQALLRRIDMVDGADRVALLATTADAAVIGHGEYVATEGSAEFALMVLPAFRTRGIGRRLLAALVEIATEAGQREMHGIIQAGNTRALQLALERGFRVVPGADRATVIVSRQLLPSLAEPFPRHGIGIDRNPTIFISHDPDRTPLHRRPGPRAPLRAGGG
jgi:GNAT superfamily N-acetyltransferase